MFYREFRQDECAVRAERSVYADLYSPIILVSEKPDGAAPRTDEMQFITANRHEREQDNDLRGSMTTFDQA